jgi:predicted secreted protein/(2Fe-2S) ferredoxin
MLFPEGEGRDAMKGQKTVAAVLAALVLLSAGLSACAVTGAEGNAEKGEKIQTAVDGTFEVSLDSNPTTGYSWQADFDEACLEFVDRTFEPSSELIGAGGTETLVFKALRAGETPLTLEYKRPWEDSVLYTETRDVEIAASTNLDDVVITLERTHCLGTCPVYTLAIYGDGTVVYEGKDFVAIEGRQETTIGGEKIEQLLAEFERTDYLSLSDSYTECIITCLPSATTSLTIDGETKTIAHYHGDLNAPAVLAELEDTIDEIAGSSQWTGK